MWEAEVVVRINGLQLSVLDHQRVKSFELSLSERYELSLQLFIFSLVRSYLSLLLIAFCQISILNVGISKDKLEFLNWSESRVTFLIDLIFLHVFFNFSSSNMVGIRTAKREAYDIHRFYIHICIQFSDEFLIFRTSNFLLNLMNSQTWFFVHF